MLRRLAAIVKSPIVRWVTTVTLLVAMLMIWRPTFTEFLELKLYDLKFRFRGTQPAGPDVVILAIDDDSLKMVGRWPWSREDMARVLARLKKAGPRVIALDIIFAEKQETAGMRALTTLGQEMSRRGLVTPALLGLLEKEKSRADVDRQLAEIIKQDPPTILGYFFRGLGGARGGIPLERLMAPSFIQASSYNLVRTLDTEPSQVPLIGAQGVELNLPEITAAAAGDGYFNMIPDADGTVRWFPMAVMYGPDFFAPMGLVSLSQYWDRAPLGITLSQVGVEEIRVGQRRVPVDWHGRLLINYLGPGGMVPTYSVAAFLEGKIPAPALQDKIVLVGATAVGIYDLRVTPFTAVCPGVEIQATVINNLLSGNFLRVPKFGLTLMLLMLIGLGIVLALMLPRMSAAWAFIFTIVLIEIYVFGNYLLFSRGGVQLEVLYPVLEIMGVYVGITVHRFLAEEKERARIRKAFESYVAPAVVQQMLKHPERLRLGGERRVITVLFTDIRGFTTMSENLDPESLVRLLHDFLNPMSNVIINEGGTIDKYMGDAIMAEFGAPLEQPDHARRACVAALEMVDTLRALNERWADEGRPLLSVGIGVNTGPVAVGNMGSDRLFDYTAIGDNVNLGSRLEGLNKYYGTNILISDTTAAALENGFILRDVDRVKVKGKAQAAGIYELLGQGEPDPDLTRFLERYHQGLELYRQRRWAESITAMEAALEVRPQDTAAQRYLVLARKHEETPPDQGWEAVTVMDGK